MPRSDLWSRDELLVVLDMYVRKGHAPSDPEVIEIAWLMGRTEGSVKLRLSNYRHVDPNDRKVGLSNGHAQCEPLFEELAGDPLRLAEEAAHARRRLHAEDRQPKETKASMPRSSRRTIAQAPDRIVEYANTRLHFNANRIEPLGWDEPFRVKTPFGVYQMTKGQFYEAFPNVVKTHIYLVGRHYHSASLHLQAERFKIE